MRPRLPGLRCTLMQCGAPATHAQLIWDDRSGQIEANPRCEPCSDLALRWRDVRKISPALHVRMVRLVKQRPPRPDTTADAPAEVGGPT